ncbi:hypothetical protein QF002_007799 [Paraburkholderia youngii]
MSPIFYASIILLFAAVVLATGGVYEYWNSRHGPVARRVDARIRAVSAGGPMSRQRLSILKTRTMAESAVLARLLLRIPRVHALDLFLQQSGLSWSVGRFFGTCAVLPPFVLIVGASLRVPWVFTTGRRRFMRVAADRLRAAAPPPAHSSARTATAGRLRHALASIALGPCVHRRDRYGRRRVRRADERRVSHRVR